MHCISSDILGRLSPSVGTHWRTFCVDVALNTKQSMLYKNYEVINAIIVYNSR